MSNIFVNLEFTNSNDRPSQVRFDESRDPYILEDPENYLATIDRFSIHKAWLPVFEHSSVLEIRLTRKADSQSSTHELDFTGLVDNNNLIWSSTRFYGALNAALALAAADLTLADVPTFSEAHATGLVTLDYSNSAGFAGLYEIAFNEELYSILSSFNYGDIVFDQEWFSMVLPDAAPHSVTSFEKANLSPVDKIFIKSSTMPLVYEYSPTGSASRAVEPILTDFEFGGANRFPLTSINYTATSGQYRLHSMEASRSFKRISLDFYYKTYSHASHPLYLMPSGSVNIKLLFKPDLSKTLMTQDQDQKK